MSSSIFSQQKKKKMNTIKRLIQNAVDRVRNFEKKFDQGIASQVLNNLIEDFTLEVPGSCHKITVSLLCGDVGLTYSVFDTKTCNTMRRMFYLNENMSLQVLHDEVTNNLIMQQRRMHSAYDNG